MADDAISHQLIDQFFRCINERDLVGFSSLLDEYIHFMMIGDTLLSGSAHSRDGRPYHNTYLHMVRVKDGKFIEFLEYLDTELINRVLLAPASGAEVVQEDLAD